MSTDINSHLLISKNSSSLKSIKRNKSHNFQNPPTINQNQTNDSIILALKNSNSINNNPILYKKEYSLIKLNKYKANEELHKKSSFLFQDPKTFLTLPTESSFNFVVGRVPRGPRFDDNDNLIPYTAVGGYKIYKTKNKFDNSASRIGKKNLLQRRDTLNILVYKNKLDVNEKEIVDIFRAYKSLINKNKTKKKLEIKLDKEFPKVIGKDYIAKPLERQEKCLLKNKEEKNITNNIEKYIKKKLFKKNRNTKDKELIMNSIQNYHFKQKIKNLKNSNLIGGTDMIEDYYDVNRNYNQNWGMSLRRPNNFFGTRKKYLNTHPDKNPFWFIATEKSPKEKEIIIDNKKMRFTDNDFYRKRNEVSTTLANLNVSGKKLIDVEEEMSRQIKGKKKVLKYRYENSYVKNMDICKEYYIRGKEFMIGKKKDNTDFINIINNKKERKIGKKESRDV